MENTEKWIEDLNKVTSEVLANNQVDTNNKSVTDIDTYFHKGIQDTARISKLFDEALGLKASANGVCERLKLIYKATDTRTRDLKAILYNRDK